MNTLESVDWSTIPAPEDDGAMSHLPGMELPTLSLDATDGQSIDLSALPCRTLVYVYPMTGRPDTALPDGWDMIPGARGCTPQSCSFRDHARELADLGIQTIVGVSTQSTEYQQEVVARLQLPFVLLSDSNLLLAKALNLPVFAVDGMTLLKRATLIIDNGVVHKVFYPIFPPDTNADLVIEWLSQA